MAASSRLIPKKINDLLPSSVVPSLQKETFSVETDSEDGTYTQPLLNNDSYLFSNFATSSVLEMLANGATGDETQANFVSNYFGKPLEQIREIFPLTVAYFGATGFAGGPKIKLATRTWVQRSMSLKRDVDDVIKNIYTTDICYLAFFSAVFKLTHTLIGEVNSWVRHKTGELIRDSFGSYTVDPATRLLSTTTLDFEGEWSVPFQDAGVRTFTLPSGGVVRAPYMTSKAKQYVKQFPNFKVLSIPYKQHKASSFTMLFYLPDERADFNELQQWIGMNEDVIMEMDLPTEQVEVENLLVPKFLIKMRGDMALEPTTYLLDNMVDNTTDDGSGGSQRLGIDKLVFNSYLEVSEKGTRASGSCTAFARDLDAKDSATDRSLVYSSSPPPMQPRAKKARFQANRPFMFFLRDTKYGRMLFTGGITDPLGTSFN